MAGAQRGDAQRHFFHGEHRLRRPGRRLRSRRRRTRSRAGCCARCLAGRGGLHVQLRLIANLLDGMVAVEGRKGGPVGDLWNEAPDRACPMPQSFIGAGYAAGSRPLLGFGAALVAVFVAYVRALGASVGVGQIFLGPAAKQQRMAVMTAACVLSAVFHPGQWCPMDAGAELALRSTIIPRWRCWLIVGSWRLVIRTAWRPAGATSPKPLLPRKSRPLICLEFIPSPFGSPPASLPFCSSRYRCFSSCWRRRCQNWTAHATHRLVDALQIMAGARAAHGRPVARGAVAGHHRRGRAVARLLPGICPRHRAVPASGDQRGRRAGYFVADVCRGGSLVWLFRRADARSRRRRSSSPRSLRTSRRDTSSASRSGCSPSSFLACASVTTAISPMTNPGRPTCWPFSYASK